MPRQKNKRKSVKDSQEVGQSEKANTSGHEVNDFPIVGIGASAGGLEVLSLLLTELPHDSGMAFIVIQHLDPTHESMTAEILSRKTKMSVQVAVNATKVQPDHIYVIPPNQDLSIRLGELRLSPRKEIRGLHLPIDSFLSSLAEDQAHKAIGVILSGTASDGTLGLEAIKAAGGVTLAQDPKSAKFGGMPTSAIASGIVDLVLSPVEIAKELVKIAHHPLLSIHELYSKDSSAESAFRNILQHLKDRCDVDFSLYKQNTLKRRIARRMILHNIHEMHDYEQFLQVHLDELEFLSADMLIHVTEFFRDSIAYEQLKTIVFPKITKNRNPDEPIRIWSVGCASGEEPYSIAISLAEHLELARLKFPIKIFATDISDSAIQKARNGLYPNSISDIMSKERLERFFTKTESGYRIDKSIRDMCIFSRHDIARDPPFAQLDFISCRNVMIYFEAELQKKILPIFHYALKENGLLWLGRSETVGGGTAYFGVIDKTNKIYSRKSTAIKPKFDFPATKHLPQFLRKVEKSSLSDLSVIQLETDRINSVRYGPPCVVVNDEGDIVFTKGDTSAFLQIAQGGFSSNLLKIVRPELVADMREALQSARKLGTPIEQDGLKVGDEHNQIGFKLSIIPVFPFKNSSSKFFLINFERNMAEISANLIDLSLIAEKSPDQVANLKLKGLEQELLTAKAYQNSLIGDFEQTQEQLTSANEELQTIIEEFQSTNEELETVNDELQTRNVDLNTLNSDLSNFMECVDIPVVMVDVNCQIRRFTTQASAILNLISTDIGRPIGDIKPNFEIRNLSALIFEVINTAITKTIEVQNADGKWFRLQIKPYRTVRQQVDGAVLILVDIDNLKTHLQSKERELNLAISVANTVQLPLAVVDSMLIIRSGNEAFYKKFCDKKKQDGIDILQLISITKNKDLLQTSLSNLVRDNKSFHDLEIEAESSICSSYILHVSGQPIEWVGDIGEFQGFLLSLEDITERRNLENSYRAAESKFKTLVDSAHDSIISVNANGIITLANKQTENVFGFPSEELIGKPVTVLIPDRYHINHTLYKDSYVIHPSARPMGAGKELFAKTKDGREVPVDISLSRSKSIDGVSVTAIIRDITERKIKEKERTELLEREQSARADAEKANQTKDAFLAMLSHELRTPLTAILSWSQMIKQSSMDSQKLKLGIDTIERNALAQGQLIDDLLDIARIQSGKLALNLGKMNPGGGVCEAVKSVELMAEQKSIKILTEIDSKLDLVFADPQRLQQIVWNLLTNAIKFSEQGQSIVVRVESVALENKKFVSIKVSDQGRGLNTDFLPNVFERFVQEDTSLVRRHGGLGLGLSIVRDLAHLMGGSVTAESPGPEKGSTFTILLPSLVENLKPGGSLKASSDLKSRSASEKDRRPDLTGLAIMIVEDELSSLEALESVLESFGATTKSFSSAKDCLAFYKKAHADVLISDIAMPGEDGYSLLRKIRSLPSVSKGRIPALALTAYAAQEDVNLSLSAGFDAHLAKPYEILSLGRIVEKLAKKNSEAGVKGLEGT